MTAPNDLDKCKTCENSRVWHERNRPIHPFNNGEAGATAFLGKRGNRTHQPATNDAQRAPETPPMVVWPNDPVLRVALMNKGLLTPDDLRAAEDQLRAAMGEQLAKGGGAWSATGEASTDLSTRTANPSTGPLSEKGSPSV